MRVFCAYDALVPIGDLRPHPRNPNTHPERQIELLAKIIRENGWRAPITVSKRSGHIVRGHGRLMAAIHAGMDECPVDYQDYESEERELQDLLADNRIAELAEMDREILGELIADLDEMGADLELAGFEEEGEEAADEAQEPDNGGLARRFIAPPLSILDARQGYWTDRKRAWRELGFRSTAGRGENLIRAGEADHSRYKTSMSHMAPATSEFDPVLAEVSYLWFCPPGGSILDPFCGGSVRGIVAAKTGHGYTGFDIRAEQVEENRAQGDALGIEGAEWICDDSRNLLDHTGGEEFDLVFSCPPYFDLEVYSDEPGDISNMDYDEFLEAYRDIIAKACSRLRDNRFAVFVVGDVRDRKGFYRDFVGDTKRAFEDAGMRLYNDIVYIEPIGTAALRAARQMNATRKVAKSHQNVLVFYKGEEADLRMFEAHRSVLVFYKGDPKEIGREFTELEESVYLFEEYADSLE